MNPNSKPSRTYYHRGRDRNLQAAKMSLRSHRGARLYRRTSEEAYPDRGNGVVSVRLQRRTIDVVL